MHFLTHHFCQHKGVWFAVLALHLCLRAAPGAPINDDFANRLRLEGTNVSVSMSNVGGTKEAGERNHAGQAGGSSVWSLWRPPQKGYAVIDTIGSSVNTVLEVYFGKELNTLSSIASNNDISADSTASRVEFDADPQRDYPIAIDGVNGAEGELRLNIRLYTHPVLVESPQSLQITEGDNATFVVGVLGSRPLRYQWQFAGRDILGANDSSYTVRAATKDHAGPYRVIVTNEYGQTNSSVALLTVLATPKILEHPLDARREAGDDVEFKVTALGEMPLAYQWYWGGQALTGAVEPVLRRENLSTDEAGLYHVIVRNAAGEAESRPAELVVEPAPPRILVQPKDQVVVEGTNVSLVATIKGYRPMEFQWFRDRTPLPSSAGTLEFPETNIVLHFPAISTNDAGLYFLEITNRYGNARSVEARLTVEPRPPNDHFERRIDISFATNKVRGFNKHGTKQEGEPAHHGQAAVHSVWWSYFATNRGIVTINLAGSSFDTLLAIYTGTTVEQLQPITSNDNDPDVPGSRNSKVSFLVEPGTEYIIAVDGRGEQQGNIELEILYNPNVDAPIIGSWGLLDGFLLLGGFGGFGGDGGCRDAVFTLEVLSLAAVAYQWQYNLKCVPETARGNWLGLPCEAEDVWIDIPGATNRTLVLTNVTVEHSGAIRLLASNIGGISTSAPASIGVSPLPWITNQPMDVVVRECASTNLQVGVDGGCDAFSYQWFFRDQPIAGATNALLSLTNAQPTQSGPYKVVMTNPHGSITSRVATVQVDSTPIITAQPRVLGSQANDCDEVRLWVEVQPACRPHQYQWLRNNIPLPNQTNSEIRFLATADTAGEYQVRVFNEYASTNSVAVNLQVKAEPFIFNHPDAQRVRVGASFTNRVEAQSCSQLSYQWLRNGDPIALDANHVPLPDGGLIVHNASPADSGRYEAVVSSATGSARSRAAEIQVLFPPPNDHFASRIQISGTNVVVLGTNVLATAEAGEPEHARQRPKSSVWWTWRSPIPCRVTLDLSGSDFNTVLGVYQGDSVDRLEPVAFDDDGGDGNTSKLVFLAARGKTFHFAVDGVSGGEGKIRLSLQAEEIISPPVILKQPRSLAASEGDSVRFDTEAYGSPDISYQWHFNGVPIAGGTNQFLEIIRVEPVHEGNYTVHLTNEFGQTNSQIARLTFGAIVEGQVTDATNRRGIPGAKVSVGGSSTVTDENGNFILVGVRPGAANADFDARKRVVRIGEKVQFDNRSVLGGAILRAEKRPEFFDYEDTQFQVQPGSSVTNKFSMSPVIAGLRFVVNWGRNPADLDAHLLTPEINGISYHVQYPRADRGRADGPPYATLDFDVQDSFGPETVTVYQIFNGVYRFYVKKFEPNAQGDLANSGAAVKIYTATGLYGTREVPTSGTGTVWHVCDIDGKRGSITWVDQILAADPQPLIGKTAHSVYPAPEIRESRFALHGSPKPASEPESAHFVWDFGDNTTTNAFEPSHAYSNPGTYTVTLRMFPSAGAGEPADVETKVNFITVYNEPPVVEITEPQFGKLFRADDPITLVAEAFDLDGTITGVEFFVGSMGTTNPVGSVKAPPYQVRLQDVQPGDYTFYAEATDNFGAVGVSAPIQVRVVDLAGDVLIIRNFDDPEVGEIETMVRYLEEIRIPASVGGDRELIVRVLDQEGLYFDLIRGFKLIIWNDQGTVAYGLTANDVDLLARAAREGIALYLMGERLGTSGFNLEESAAEQWAKLSHLRPPTSIGATGLIRVLNERPRHELFSSRFGVVTEFMIPGEPFELCELDVSSGQVDIEATVDDHPALLRHPSFAELDFGEPRRITQNFRVVSGDDPESLEERRKLYLNAVAWLLRLSDCQAFGGFVYCEEPSAGKVGEPMTFTSILMQNGECTAGGMLLTNQIAPDLDVVSFEVNAMNEHSDTNLIQWSMQTNAVVCRFARLPSGSVFEFKLTAIPKRGGFLTNWHHLNLGLISREPCAQVAMVEGGCDQPVKLQIGRTVSGEIVLNLMDSPGCAVDLQASDDLKNWETIQRIPVSSSSLEIQLGWPQATQRYFRCVPNP